ncbi:MAG: uracil-DNA glycosylase family protein [Tannerellaceae bacterium]|jgi:G:T/U-mismatch repair DNA glycosylase|nr:uracil-DNA glycosylase family protein [Tannerellaceae bacterium]
MNEKVETHPLPPFFPDGAKLLMLGSFPPGKERWTMDFFYPNILNDMWRIFGHIFFKDEDRFISANGKSFIEADIRLFLEKKKIALWDTVMEARRLKDNASDKFLETVTPIDIEATMERLPSCYALAVMGKKALDTLRSVVDAEEPVMGEAVPAVIAGRSVLIYRMPSSSRAYPRSIKEKAAAYSKMFTELEMIND